jgi:hypothetical protein
MNRVDAINSIDFSFHSESEIFQCPECYHEEESYEYQDDEDYDFSDIEVNEEEEELY